MNIAGNNKNHVIAWGGGFNINKGETVNFKGSGTAFLNLDYSNKASKILGTLNGNGNNIYLVNPSGVLIGENGKVNNVSRFVASTSSLDKALKDFTKYNANDSQLSFSPVFNPSQGNIVNMGNIRANEIVLMGNEVRNRTYVKDGDRNGVLGKFESNGNGKLFIVGNKIFLDADGVKGNSNIELMGFNDDRNNIADIKVQMAMSTFASKRYNYNIDNWIKQTYTDNGANTITNIGSIYNIITIGATGGWDDFATAWNSGLGITRDIEEFKLIKDIDFGNGAFTSVGKVAGFNKIFNGNGYTMLNIKLTNSNVSSESGTDIVGIFNKIGGGTIKDLTINRVSTENIPKVDILHLGAFAGQINGGTIENVTVNNINIKGSINYSYANGPTNDNGYMGGFAGKIENASKGKTTIDGVILNKIGTLYTDTYRGYGSKYDMGIGGFVAQLGSGNSINNVYLYFTENSKLAPAAALNDNKDSRNQVSTFYHSMTGGNTFNNINIVYNTHITDPSPYGSGIIFDRDGYNIDQVTGFIYYTAKGMIEGIKQVERADNKKYGNTVNFKDYNAIEDDNFFNDEVKKTYPGVTFNGGNYSWVTWSNISGTYPMNGNLNGSGDYTTLIDKYLPQIIDDILEAKYGVTIENKDGSSTQKSLENIRAELDKILKVISDREDERTADGKITNFLNQILVGDDKTNAELKESIKQSINFLRAFYEGYDNGSKQNAVTKTHSHLFSGNADYTNATNKYKNAIKGGMTSLRETINGKLADIKTLEQALKDLNNVLEEEKALDLDGKIAQLQDEVKNINKEIEKLNEKIAGFGTDIESLDKEIAKFGITLEALDNEIAGLKTKIADTKEAINKVPRPEYKEVLKKQLAALEAQLAEKEPKREELNSFITTKNELQAALDERNKWKAKGEEKIAQIETEKGKLTALKNNADGYVAEINGIREGFINDLKINKAQDIELMAGADKGSFTFYGVIDDKTHDITDKVEIPSIIETPAPQPKPEEPKPEPEPTPEPEPDPEQPEQPEQPERPERPEIDNSDDGGGDNGDNEDNSYEGDDTVNNNGGYDARLAYLNYKREVLELPAEEETSIEINEGREKGRLCIVSDNAKTNTPCMAITY